MSGVPDRTSFMFIFLEGRVRLPCHYYVVIFQNQFGGSGDLLGL